MLVNPWVGGDTFGLVHVEAGILQLLYYRRANRESVVGRLYQVGNRSVLSNLLVNNITIAHLTAAVRYYYERKLEYTEWSGSESESESESGSVVGDVELTRGRVAAVCSMSSRERLHATMHSHVQQWYHAMLV